MFANLKNLVAEAKTEIADIGDFFKSELATVEKDVSDLVAMVKDIKAQVTKGVVQVEAEAQPVVAEVEHAADAVQHIDPITGLLVQH